MKIIYTKQKTLGIDGCFLELKNENDKTTFAWSDTEQKMYDLPENLEYQFRWKWQKKTLTFYNESAIVFQ